MTASDHTVTNLHFPLLTERLPGTLLCSCKAALTAEPDRHRGDPWEPLVEVWHDHRRSVGLGVTREGHLASGEGWDGSWGSTTKSGGTRRTASERGHMGVAAKRAKAKAAKGVV